MFPDLMSAEAEQNKTTVLCNIAMNAQTLHFKIFAPKYKYEAQMQFKTKNATLHIHRI